jgi:hypothetical protein
MAQHDYVIDNQASASARADLNSLFQAIASQNSGATAPTTTYANQIWYDTATDLLKMRNEANSGWITLGTVDQTNNVFNPNFLPATQAEAEAGTNNVKGVTPLRVAQAIAALASAGTTVNIQVFTATGTYTPTAGYKWGIAFVTGGGGGTRGIGTTDDARGGAGGGGTAIGLLNLTTLGSVTATVGAGGTAGAGSGTNGANGTSAGASTLSTLTGGAGFSVTGASSGGEVGGSATGGILNISGGYGGSSFIHPGTPMYSYGCGGASFYGGTGGNSSAISFGAGGGGRATTGTTAGTSGMQGVIMIMEFK